MLGRRSTTSRGDTIVEVLFAITIFSMIAVAAISLMNKGMATAQRSLEITAVRQQIDGQADTLRFLHDAYVNSYQAGAVNDDPATPAGKYHAILTDHTGTTVSAFEGGTCTIPTARSNVFVVSPKNGTVNQTITEAPAAAGLAYTGATATGEGIWVEALRSPAPTGTQVGFIDFHIRACWSGVGDSIPTTLGTIVRLYDPK